MKENESISILDEDSFLLYRECAVKGEKFGQTLLQEYALKPIWDSTIMHALCDYYGASIAFMKLLDGIEQTKYFDENIQQNTYALSGHDTQILMMCLSAVFACEDDLKKMNVSIDIH